MKLGFLGFGNMAGAIAGGILKGGILQPQEIAVYDVNESARTRAKVLGFTVLENAGEVLKQASYVALCVKPQSFPELLRELKANLQPNNVFLSIAAGVTIASIQRVLGDVCVVRAMPNTPLLLGCGTTALTKSESVTAEDFSFFVSVFKSVGTVYELPEDKFNEVINVNGSTPAYIYLFAKTVAEFAQESGIAFDVALAMFCDTLKGSAEMLTQSGHSPDELITMVSSKGGTTVAALNTFAQTGFVESLQAGMRACVKRAYEMNLS